MKLKTYLATGAFLYALSFSQNSVAQEAEAGPDDAIVVTGTRAQQEGAIAAKRESLGIVDVAAADEIGQLPDRNVAEVIERLPGVGVQYDQGEGRYVSVRGIPSDLNNYTVNGFEIGNPDGSSRRLPLDVVSGQLLNRVEVSKAKTSDQDGQGIGATINLVPQTAFDFDKSFVLAGTGQIGFQQLNNKNPIKADVMVGGRFGADEQFGVLIGGSYSNRTFRSAGFFPDDWAPSARLARGGLPINIKFTDYELERERIGAVASLDWRPDDGTELYLRGLYSKFTEDEYRQRFRLDFSNATPDALIASGRLVVNTDGVTGISTQTDQRQDLRLEYKEKSILSLSAGGRFALGDATSLEFAGSRVHNEVIEPNRLWTFRDVPGTVSFDFSEKLYTARALTPLGTNIGFRQYSEQDENGEEDIWAGRIDLKHELSGMENSWIRAGAKLRMTDKFFDVENRLWDRASAASGQRFTLGSQNLAGPAVLVRVGRGYTIDSAINEDAIIAFTDANLTGPRFVLNTTTTLRNGTLSDFTVDEDVYAGYAMANLDFGVLAVTAGLRYEKTELAIDGFRLLGTTVVPSAGQSSYDNWLPSVIARIEPSDNFVARFAYYRALGRPQYSQLSPSGTITIEAGEAFVSSGNPDLKPFIADSFDASFEYYFARGSLLSLGVFAKKIRNPLFTAVSTAENVTIGGVTYARARFSTPQNGGKADVVGIELNYQHQLTFLPGLLSGFGVGANVTLTDSNLDGNPFPEQSGLLYGAQLFYQKGIVDATIAYHHTGRALLALGGTRNEDQFNDDIRRLDAKLTLNLTPNISVFGEATNLTDEPTRQYQAGIRDWTIQTERYGRAYAVGASVRW
jgi:TonB-dependent receptor